MPRRYSMDTRAEQAQAVRTRILDAAVEVMGEQNVATLKLQTVAARADVALRTVYNHFDSKEALVVEAYERLAEAARQAAAGVPADGPVVERLGAFITAFYEYFEREWPGAAAILNVNGIPEFDARLREVRAWRRKEITALLRPAAQDGSLRIPLKQAAAVVFALTSFATWSSLVKEGGLSTAAAAELAHSILERSLFD